MIGGALVFFSVDDLVSGSAGRFLSSGSVLMTSRVRRIGVLTAVVVLAGLGLLLLAMGDPSSLQPPHHDRLLILMFGTLFGQTSLAAAWCALGPFSLARRLTMSSMWLAAIVVAIGSNNAGGVHPSDIDGILTFGAIVLCQWMLIVVPLWLVAAWWNLRCVANGMTGSSPEHCNRQIGIREAMFLTAVVAAVLGTASFRSGRLSSISINWEVVRIFGFLTVASAVIAFPLTLLVLVCRKWLRPLGGALLLFAAATALELAVSPLAWPGPRIDLELFWSIALVNLVQSAWIALALSLLRTGGYELRSRRGMSATEY
jgi:hypothetical protein